MKINTKLSKVVKTAAKATKVAPKKAELSVLDAYDIKHCKMALKKGLDAAGSWLYKRINDALVTTLISNREKISSTRLAKTDRVLFISTPKNAFAWPLTGMGTDIYERTHEGAPVRGYVSALKKAWGEKNVRLVGKQEAVKLLKTLTPEKASAKAFGVA